jgi:hypothetical protein
MKLAAVVFMNLFVLSTLASADDSAPDILSCKAKVTTVLGEKVTAQLESYSPPMASNYLTARIGAVVFDVRTSNGYLFYWVRMPHTTATGDLSYKDTKSIKFSASPDSAIELSCESL